jgi:acetoacetyl-CoA synthetase
MMWNWLVSALATGSSVVLYDGSPFHPTPSRLWDLVDEFGITCFGTSAKFIDASRKAGVRPRQTHQLDTMRTITSTGSPLVPEGFEYVYEHVKENVHLASISGGTDICGCFVIGDPTKPVYAGEIQTPGFGMSVDVYSEDGRSLADSPDVRGELVCTQSFPSMPIAFWDDADNSKYRAAYFDRFPGVWAQGDFAAWTRHAGLVIHGRSDATLNAGGVRIGTAEIYRQVESFPEILEALAIGQAWDDDTRIVLFVRLAAGHALTDELVKSIKKQLRENSSPRHVPARIVAVSDLPRTRSNKLAELAVADVVHGRQVRNVEALANPEALELFRDLPELAD